MNFLPDFIKAFKAEWLKLKNSGVFWLVLAMAAFIPIIFTIAGLVQNSSEITSVDTENSWKELIISCFQGFGTFFFPVFLTLVVVRLTQMEHRGGGWKLIEVQPISKLSLYLGKFSMSVIVSMLCIITLILFGFLSGTIIMLAKPGSNFSKFSIPFDFILGLGFRMLISGLGVLAIQYLFSVVISGFLLPFGIGLVATITGTILFGFGKALWWPYSAPALTVTNPNGSQTGTFFMFYEWLSIAWMLLALWLGFQWYQRKTFVRAYFKPFTRVFHIVIPGVLFALFFVYINKPVELPSHSRTVIAGVFDTKESIKVAYLVSEPYYDSVLVIPVENNKFSYTTTKDISPGVYYFKGGNMSPEKIFFGNNDSLYIKVKSDGRSGKVTTSGNRMAENEYLKRGRSEGGYNYYYLENFGYEMKPEKFSRELVRLWKNELGRLNDYKTADNLKPSPDFIALQQKLIALRYLKLLDTKYVQRYKVYHPNEKLELPKTIDELRNAVSYNDSSLMGYEEYRTNMTEYYQQKHRLSLSNDTAYITKLSSILPAGDVRNYLVYNKLKETIGRTRDSSTREMLMIRYLPFLENEKMQQQLIAQHLLLKSLNRGKPAPEFLSVALSKDTFSLAEFKGRYIIIDVWATWCAPCRVQSPSFERLAEQYTNPNVAFVALSIDHDKWSWQYEAPEKSIRVLQLIATDKDQLGRLYGIDYIPRYMMIGPDGKIINAQMPEPSNPLFEDIIKREIPGLSSP